MEEKISVRTTTKVIIGITNVLSIILPLLFYTILPAMGYDLTIIHRDADNNIVINYSRLIYVIISFVLSISIIVVNVYLSTKGYSVITRKTYDNMINTIDSLNADLDIYTNYINVFNELCKDKGNTLKQIVKENLKTNKCKDTIITNPQQQLTKIFNPSMLQLLSMLTGISYTHISVAVAYRYNSQEWCWLSNCEPDHRWSAEDLSKNKESTFYEILNSKDGYVFHNSKITAMKHKHYIPNENVSDDNNTIIDGSIIGKHLRIGDYENPSAEIVYFFTTTNNHNLLKINVQNEGKEILFKKKLSERFFREFDKRIIIEFSLLYLNTYETK